MDVAKWVSRVFFVLLAMVAAWLLYSLLLEYPYSTVLSLGSNINWEGVDTNQVMNATGKNKGDYVGTPTKAGLWAATDALQIPFGSYYFYYTMLPNMRADEGVNDELCRAIGINNDDYGYKLRLANDMMTMNAVTDRALNQNLIGYIPMNLSFDDNDDMLMNYPKDTDTGGKFYTTGWY